MSTALGLLLRWVRSTEWRWFLDFASPAFFEVMPLGALARSVRGLAAGTRDVRGFQRARAAAESVLRARSIPVRILPAHEAGAGAPDAAALSEEARRQLGQRVLEIYFAQLLGAETALLDLRAGRFAPAPGGARCRDAGVRLHADFLPLGVALACLYDGLEALAVPLDVRDAFERAAG